MRQAGLDDWHQLRLVGGSTDARTATRLTAPPPLPALWRPAVRISRTSTMLEVDMRKGQDVPVVNAAFFSAAGEQRTSSLMSHQMDEPRLATVERVAG